MKPHLRAVGLEKSYGRKKVLNGVSVGVSRGEVVGLLGPNGAGKTTTFSILVGLIPHDEGKIFLDDEDITGMPMYLRAQKGICLLPQEPSVFRRLSTEANLLAILEVSTEPNAMSREEAAGLLSEFGLEKVAKSRAVMLSGGERRRLEIARAMVTGPEFILLDEPFTGIDPLATRDLQEIILSLKERGLGIVVTDHNVRDTLKITDRAYIIDKGEILMEGTPRDLVVSETVREHYLGEDFRLS